MDLAVVFQSLDTLYIILFGIVAIVLISVMDVKIDKIKKERWINESQNIDTIADHLKVLEEYVKQQKIKVKENEQILINLEKENSVLSPIVNLKKEEINAVLSAQSQYQKRSRWKDRLFGFIIGLLSSLIASFIANNYF